MVADDEEQLGTVRDLLKRRTLYIPMTVLLEAHWVLRSRYGFSAKETAAALQGLARLEGIELQNSPSAEWALTRFAEGADLADMLHLASCENVDGLATFDRKLRRSAGDDLPVQVLTLR